MKTQNELIDETAHEIKLAALRNAINESVTIERIRYSGGDTQYRVSGVLGAVDVARGTITLDMTRGHRGATRTIRIAEVVKLLVWGTGEPGTPTYVVNADQYDWMREATEVVEAADETLVACACGGGFVDPVNRERNEAHIHSPAHVGWITKAEREAHFTIWNDDAMLVGREATLDEIVRLAEAMAENYAVGEKLVVQREGHGVVYVAKGRKHREAKDATGEALVPGTVYRVTRGTFYPEFAIYRDTVVEDDDSLTLVFETADGRRDGYSEARTTVEPISIIPECSLPEAPDALAGWTESEKASAYGK